VVPMSTREMMEAWFLFTTLALLVMPKLSIFSCGMVQILMLGIIGITLPFMKLPLRARQMSALVISPTLPVTDSFLFTVKNQEPFKDHFYTMKLWLVWELKLKIFHKLKFICQFYKKQVFRFVFGNCLSIKIHIDIMGKEL